ncbi:MAG: GNAT family N-acetyltransferase [Candidatus Xenobia bacterium]
MNPAYRIETERLVLRCWNPSDARLLQATIEDNLEHLRLWMPWIKDEPLPFHQRVALLCTFRSRFDLNQDFIYGIFTPDESRVLGGCGSHTRLGMDVRELGYWMDRHHVNRGLATELSAALTRVAFEVDCVSRVEIQCGPENYASAAVPRKLGFTHDATLRQRFLRPDGSRRDTMIWTLLADEFPRSPAAGAKLKAYDVIGERLL